ncbi:hypothetical protein [Rhizobium sp. NFACC06-2]|uniref:hypothetical protein n=1 Tax=Rhizobium sp. NFACC06-2 TaxID=1566264 RepID=UPI00122CC48A|nr:hypothetical protein [Rhizobium sp. NFACC06-2]
MEPIISSLKELIASPISAIALFFFAWVITFAAPDALNVHTVAILKVLSGSVLAAHVVTWVFRQASQRVYLSKKRERVIREREAHNELVKGNLRHLTNEEHDFLIEALGYASDAGIVRKFWMDNGFGIPTHMHRLRQLGLAKPWHANGVVPKLLTGDADLWKFEPAVMEIREEILAGLY